MTHTAPESIIMFGADWCRDCRQAKETFARFDVPYTYVDLVADETAAQVAEDISGRRNIPVIVYPDQSHQVEPRQQDIVAKLVELEFISSPS